MDVRFAYQANCWGHNCWGQLGGNAVGVTSIGQLTYLTFGDIGRAIAEIGAAGYQGVELFDGNVLDYPGGAKALRGEAGRGRRQTGRCLFRREFHLPGYSGRGGRPHRGRR